MNGTKISKVAFFGAVVSLMAGCATPLPNYQVHAYTEAELLKIVDPQQIKRVQDSNHPIGHWYHSNDLEITVMALGCGNQYVDPTSMLAEVSGNVIRLKYRLDDKDSATAVLCCAPIKLTYRLKGIVHRPYFSQVVIQYSSTDTQTRKAMPLLIEQ